ncbi:MAG: FISUMP domain-containing protein, partial [Bacteroidota bacterium]
MVPNTPEFEFCPGSPTVTDVDGNTYNTVLLGDRCWTRTNLKVSKFRNGDALGSDPSLGYWSSVNPGSFTPYNNQAANKNEYGYLYNAYAALDARGICPLGWHVPTDAEWYQMVKSLDPSANANVTGVESISAGGPLKSTGLWNRPNIGGNNASGFGAVPGGFRSESGAYGAQLDGGTYWSSSLDGSAKTWFRYLYDDNASVVRNSGNMRQGRSIRCIRDLTGTGGGGGGSDTLQAPNITTLTISGITVNQANSGGTISSDGGSPVLQRGVAYGQIPLPDLSQSYTMDGYGSGSFSSQLSNLAVSTLYYVRAYATNAVGTSFGQALSFTTSTLPPPSGCLANACPSMPTVTDYDGQVYGTVQIGNQCWMASNLRAVSYRNGDAILPWSNQSNVGYQAVYDDLAANAPIYGRLYNSYAVLDSRELC